ncbi:hypothetical protein BOW51_11785 [Solemya velesiana gill symbiont]|uniref:Uncharacterized protein n=1 Tax=Solemya velesiana gill symbiont TaxID=1918948 RepID=A0A1T2KPZ5_9GAMM|nr:hypothetical protein BOW51_11785 [Solemya velesiana gill symbiont]
MRLRSLWRVSVMMAYSGWLAVCEISALKKARLGVKLDKPLLHALHHLMMLRLENVWSLLILTPKDEKYYH